MATVKQPNGCGQGWGQGRTQRTPMLMLAALLLMASGPAAAGWDLELGADARYFPQLEAYGQAATAFSAVSRARYQTDWNEGADFFELEGFYRWSDRDDERSHGDIQDLAWIHVADGWELRSGVRTVFWGVTEFQHLVDIINQTDLAEHPDGEAKLGQPMLNLSLVRDWGIVDLFLLAGFRERIFPGEDGRPRLPLVVDTDHAGYASGTEDKHLDVAVRWAGSLADWELALSYFAGTSREPEFRGVTDDFKLVPWYAQIEQVALEAQYTQGFWLWKLEALSRTGQQDGRYAATVFGFEYTIEGVLDTVADLGLVAEYNWDERGDDSPSFLDDDLALGLRWVLNNETDTDLLVGVVLDPVTSERLWTLEGHHRIGSDWMLTLECLSFASRRPPDALVWLTEDTYRLAPNSHDDFLQLELTRYF